MKNLIYSLILLLSIFPFSIFAQDHSLVIKHDGTVWAWGKNTLGQLGNASKSSSNEPTKVAYTPSISQVSTGELHSIALASDGSIYTWGDNTYGQLGSFIRDSSRNTPSKVFSFTTYKAVAAGASHCLALSSDGTVSSWGNNTSGQLGTGVNYSSTNYDMDIDTSGVLSGKTIIAIAAGHSHSLAVASDGTVYSWGNNFSGQLGNGNYNNSNVPVAVSTTGVLAGKKIIAVAAGYSHSLALASDGTIYAWGGNSSGQLGNGNNISSNLPVAVYTTGAIAGKAVTTIASGFLHNLALTSDGSTYSWGANISGQLGNGSNNSTNVPVEVNTTDVLLGKKIITINAGAYHSFVVASDGITYSWGLNSFGQLGNGNNTSTNIPVTVRFNAANVLIGKNISAVYAGSLFSIALGADNTFYSWGDNSAGQLGNGNKISSNTPVVASNLSVLSNKVISAVATGGYHCLVLTSDGTVYAWGDNSAGQLGNGNNISSDIPVTVSTNGVLAGKKIIGIAAGMRHSIVVTSDGNLYSWGYNAHGQLGNASTINSNVPVAIAPASSIEGKSFIAVAAGAYSCTAISTDGQLVAWGWNSNGQLGIGNYSFITVPWKVDYSIALKGKKMVYVSSGYEHTIALDSDGRAYAWGVGEEGRLGNASGTNSMVPVYVYSLGILAGKKITKVAAGCYHSLALDSEGRVYSWGRNAEGQLGIGDYPGCDVPVSIDMNGALAGKKIIDIAVGLDHNIALASDGSVYLWGKGDYGQLGSGNYSKSYLPSLTYTGMGLLPIQEKDVSPQQFFVSQNYPNPFNPETSIEFALPVSGKVKVVVYSTLGEVIAEVANGAYSAGSHKLTWNAASAGVASGVYFYEVSVIGDNGKEFREMKKMILLK